MCRTLQKQVETVLLFSEWSCAKQAVFGHGFVTSPLKPLPSALGGEWLTVVSVASLLKEFWSIFFAGEQVA